MPKERSKLLPGAAAGSWPAENCNSQISTREKSVLSRRNMGVWTSQNATLLSYLYAAHSSPEVRDGWHGAPSLFVHRHILISSVSCW